MMVVARSTLCFQSSLRTRARAPRAVSDHRHTNTNQQRHTRCMYKRTHRCVKERSGRKETRQKRRARDEKEKLRGEWLCVKVNQGQTEQRAARPGVNLKKRGGMRWAMGASQRNDVCPRLRLLFPRWTQASRFTRTLGSYQHWTGWCGATDRVSWRCSLTDTNEAVQSHVSCRGWWLHAVAEEIGRLSRKGAQLELSLVFFSVKEEQSGRADESQQILHWGNL